MKLFVYININNPTDYKVAGYVRLSKEDDDRKLESESVTNQRALIKTFLKENKLNLIDFYVDDGVSGTTFDRPNFNRLVEDINNKKINMVITKDLSRLGRDYIQTGFYLEKFFPENKVRYISILDGVDTGVESSANDITPFKAIMNDMYAKDISKKITSVKRDKQRKGLFIGGKACYGYKLDPNVKNKIIIDEVVAPNVKRAFNMALEGYSGRLIAKTFTDEGIPTPAHYANLNIRGGKPTTHFWKTEFIKEMLRNETYIGNMVQGRKRKISYKSKKEMKMPKNQWVVVENTHEPIIDKEVFDKVQLILDKQKPIREKRNDYFLKGLVYCHECGYLLGIDRRNLAIDGEVFYFRCRTHIRDTQHSKCYSHSMREDKLTNIVMDVVKVVCKKYFDKEKVIDIYQKEKIRIEERKSDSEKLEEINAKLNKLDLALDRIYNDRLSGFLQEKDFERMYTEKREERNRIEKEVNILKSRIEESSSKKDSKDEELNKLLKKFLNTKKPNRALVFSLIDKIELTKDSKIIVKFKFKKLNDLT